MLESSPRMGRKYKDCVEGGLNDRRPPFTNYLPAMPSYLDAKSTRARQIPDLPMQAEITNEAKK